jgi:hypothetical protein
MEFKVDPARMRRVYRPGTQRSRPEAVPLSKLVREEVEQQLRRRVNSPILAFDSARRIERVEDFERVTQQLSEELERIRARVEAYGWPVFTAVGGPWRETADRTQLKPGLFAELRRSLVPADVIIPALDRSPGRTAMLDGPANGARSSLTSSDPAETQKQMRCETLSAFGLDPDDPAL